MHAMTYVQHWGLGREENNPDRYSDLAWEDSCKIQIWLTFGIPYHQGHHAKNVRPYYRLAPTEGSPRQPAGYVVLLVAACFPFVWRALMTPALEAWRAGDRPMSAGRGLICIRRA
jgi:alkane 1-monooxygenase